MADFSIFNSGYSGDQVNNAVAAVTVSVTSYSNLPAASGVSLSNKIYITTDTNKLYRSNGVTWVELGGAEGSGVSSVGGRSGAITTTNTNGTNGTIDVNSSNVMTVQSIPFRVGLSAGSRPTAANTAGGLIPIVCPSNLPVSDMYSGYLYILVEELT